MTRDIMLACNNLKNEILNILSTIKADYPVLFIPTELHLFPDKLRNYLQSTIDSLVNVDRILLPMGRCGNGTLGLVSKNASLVLPKCGDCIDLLLSGGRIEPERPKYSYFLTAGWLGSRASIDTEYNYTINKYGKKAVHIIRTIYNNYKYFTLVDTKSYDLEKAREAITPLASAVNIEINRMEGPCGVLRKMLSLDFDANFLIVPPGVPVSEEQFAPAHQ